MMRRLVDTLEQWRHGRMSLRTRLTGAFTLVVIGGTAVSTLFGSRIVSNALLAEARSRAVQGVNAAQEVYAETLASTLATVRAEADTAAPRQGVTGRPPRDGTLPLSRLDFAGVMRSPDVTPCPASASITALLASGMRRAIVSTEVVPRSCLLPLGIVTAGALEPTASASSASDPAVLAIVAAAPAANGPGAVYGGIVLNGRSDVVDSIKGLVYGSGSFDGREVGSASIYLANTRVAGTPTVTGGHRDGSTVPPDVVRAVLAQGRTWDGRTRLGDDWYVSAYQPIRNFSGTPVGMLSVGTLEARILAARTHVMLTFLVVCLFGLVVVFGMTVLITRRTISPLESMAAATRKIAAGDLGVRVSVSADDEIGDLAGAFNVMLSSLETSKRELEEWNHTLEDKVKERTEQLVAVQADMARAQKLASIGRLAAGVAHSINNPLGGILSLSMLAAEDCRDPALSADLNTISTQAMRCREIVKGLLEFSHQSDARVAETDVNAIVSDSVQLLERQSAFHNVTIARRLQDGLPPVVINPGQLQDAVTNLLVNAVDAMEGGGTLTVEAMTAGAADVVIRIGDTGCGIPEEHMPYLFEPFFTTKRVGKGTGLGLAITHGVVTKAGGRIEVASSPAGTTFTIHLPAAPAAVPAHDELAGAGAR